MSREVFRRVNQQYGMGTHPSEQRVGLGAGAGAGVLLCAWYSSFNSWTMGKSEFQGSVHDGSKMAGMSRLLRQEFHD